MGVGIIASSVVTAACTNLLQEPFTNFTTNGWNQSGTPSIVTGRNGNAASTNANADFVWYPLGTANENDTITCGFAWRSTLVVDQKVIALGSDSAATMHVTLLFQNVANGGRIICYRGDGTALLGQTGTGQVTASTWYYIEIKAKLHDSTGTVVINKNGSEVLNLTAQDTKNAGTKTVFDSVRIRGTTGNVQDVDDLYISVGSGCSFQGDHAIS